PYVGETEQRLARSFREASKLGAVLMLDEVDSFLRDRRLAQVHWEISQVNELLVQMEAFSGLLIAATNLFAELDAAALRRFDLKVRFDYLRPDQAWGLFRAALRELGGRSPQPHPWQARLAELGQLTPGDFAVVVRRQRLLGNRPTPEDLLAALRAELEASGRCAERSIGFLAKL
ncbi:MAG: ATP-binding protein, partial [Geminicoccaceae bacterium]|nr:ATP-binding protein [Geminicoccaceae bacterium]